jgi:hypothetical protein
MRKKYFDKVERKGLENGKRYAYLKRGNRKNKRHFALAIPAEYSKKEGLSVSEVTRVNDAKGEIPTETG